MKRLSPGTAGWVSVGAVVVAAEIMDARTMSEAFRMASRHPVGGPVIFASWAVLTAHLFGAIPPKYDPFHRCTSRLTRSRKLLWREASSGARRKPILSWATRTSRLKSSRKSSGARTRQSAKSGGALFPAMRRGTPTTTISGRPAGTRNVSERFSCAMMTRTRPGSTTTATWKSCT